MFAVYQTDNFDKEVNKWSKEEQNIVRKFVDEISYNPYVGKILTFYFLREKKLKEKRIYYLLYEDLGLVLFVAGSKKKDQKSLVNEIKNNRQEFRELAIKLSNSSNSSIP